MGGKRVLVAMSGGVDSSVAALLLKQKGYELTGIFMKVSDENDRTTVTGPSCYSPGGKDIEDLKRVAEMLGIKVVIVDLSQQYNKVVLDYFRQEYLRGRTPNPCIVCNRYLKFGLLIKKAIADGLNFDFFATGHYVNVLYDSAHKRYRLKKGRDKEKDQSYFLFLLTQSQLSKSIFPLGNYIKTEVREIARRYHLPVSDKEESQDFVLGKKDIVFGNKIEEGRVVDKEGNTLGKHKGIIYYTIGQRKGFGIGAGKPLYVVEIDATNNKIVLGEKADLYRKQAVVTDVHFTGVKVLTDVLRCKVKIRYKHPAADAVVYPEKDGRVKITFEKPQWAITPGQAAVCYRKDVLLGGGFIEKVL